MTAAELFSRDAPRYVESATGRIGKYPRTRWRRWALRALLAVPFVLISIWFDIASGHDWSGTANAALAARVDGIAVGRPGIDVVAALYPPITSLIAIVIPGGALGLAIAGSLVAALTLQLVLQSSERKGFARPVRIVFLLALALTPAFSYIATTNFEATLGLMFFGLGMLDLVRFVTFANTQAGFRAGILFACSAFSDTTGLFAAIVAAFAGTLIIQSRAGARLANAVVVVFPTLALMGALALLGVAFGAGALAMIHGSLQWDADRAAAYLSLISTGIYLAPTAIVLLAAILLGYPGVGFVGVLLTAMTGLALILGLAPPGTAGNVIVMMMLVAVAIVPTVTTVRQAVIVIATAILLCAAGWGSAFQQAPIVDWLRILTGVSS